MRLLLALVVICGTAEARSWSDLVGDYTGKLAWTGCTAPGAKSATLSVDATDGALAIDLAPAGGGLVAMSLVESDRGKLSAQQGDVTLAITPGRPNTIALAIDLTSGCAIRGTLVRAITKVPACDRLVGAGRIAQKCTKLPVPIAPIASKVWKARDAAACATRAEAIETQVIDAGCLPVEDPLASTLGLQCRQLISEAEKLKRCPSAPPEMVMAANRIITIAQPAADGTSRAVVEASCREGHDMVVELAARVRCPL
ncbi:MAG: hypothetical protein H0T46_33295 [Deltaproteobacteria bacterium]|nr:hypothetical protein [Deltaproteobacteria bacterium]